MWAGPSLGACARAEQCTAAVDPPWRRACPTTCLTASPVVGAAGVYTSPCSCARCACSTPAGVAFARPSPRACCTSRTPLHPSDGGVRQLAWPFAIARTCACVHTCHLAGGAAPPPHPPASSRPYTGGAEAAITGAGVHPSCHSRRCGTPHAQELLAPDPALPQPLALLSVPPHQVSRRAPQCAVSGTPVNL